MHRIRTCCLPLVLTLALMSPGLAEVPRFVGEVVGISDGDTIRVMQHGKAVTVRLHGIDTPEKRQAFGTKARQCTADLVFRQTVTVVVPAVRARGYYARAPQSGSTRR